jgi:hypothetical protein
MATNRRVRQDWTMKQKRRRKNWGMLSSRVTGNLQRIWTLTICILNQKTSEKRSQQMIKGSEWESKCCSNNSLLLCFWTMTPSIWQSFVCPCNENVIHCKWLKLGHPIRTSPNGSGNSDLQEVTNLVIRPTINRMLTCPIPPFHIGMAPFETPASYMLYILFNPFMLAFHILYSLLECTGNIFV